MRIRVAAFGVLWECGVIGDCQMWLTVPAEWNAIHALGMNALPSLALTFWHVPLTTSYVNKHETRIVNYSPEFVQLI